MTEIITTQLVGAHFRPPAKALLACLPAGHPLLLRPEPTNEYDENAVQVLLRTETLTPLCNAPFFSEELNNQLEGAGFDLQTILESDEWHLGYLPRAAKGNQALEAWNIEVQVAVHTVLPANADGTFPCAPARLSFDASGKPTVIIPWPPAPEHE